MKLGFVVYITNGGMTEVREASVNRNEQWASHTFDVREVIRKLDCFDESGGSILLVKFLGNLGYLISIVVARPQGSGRPNDNTSAWMFIPSGCGISAKETECVIEEVKSSITMRNGIDFNRLRITFDKDYGSSNSLISVTDIVKSVDDEKSFAVRYYNDGCFQLYELLGPALAQEQYSNYSSIVFIDKGKGIVTNNTIIDDEPKNICHYEPLCVKDGFEPYVLKRVKDTDSWEKFDKPVEVPVGYKLTIEWKKEGYLPIRKSFVAQMGNDLSSSVKIEPSDCKIEIRRSMFKIFDNRGCPVYDSVIRINDFVMQGESMGVSASMYNKGFTISVSANGFSEFRKTNVTSFPLDVRLSKDSNHYQFTMPVFDDNDFPIGDVTFDVNTTQLLSKSPIKGYHAVDGVHRGCKNYLTYHPDWKCKLKYFLFGIISFLLLSAIFVAIEVCCFEKTFLSSVNNPDTEFCPEDKKENESNLVNSSDTNIVTNNASHDSIDPNVNRNGSVAQSGHPSTSNDSIENVGSSAEGTKKPQGNEKRGALKKQR